MSWNHGEEWSEEQPDEEELDRAKRERRKAKAEAVRKALTPSPNVERDYRHE